MNKGAYNSIEDFKREFFILNRPYYSVYNGHSKAQTELSFRLQDEEDIEKSWNILEPILFSRLRGGGKLTVFINDKKLANGGYTIYLDIPGPNNMPNAGMGSPYLNPTFGNFDLDKEKRLWEMEHTINQLQADKDANIGAFDKILNRLGENLPIEQICMHFIQKFAPIQAGGAMNGPTGIKGQTIETINAEAQELTAEENERLRVAIIRLSKHFPDFISTVEQLADTLDKNPSMAAMFLNLK